MSKIYGWLGVAGLVVVAAIAAFIAGQIAVHQKVASAERRPVKLEDVERVKKWRREILPLCAPGGGLERLVPDEKQAAKLEKTFGVQIASEAEIRRAAELARRAAAGAPAGKPADQSPGGEIEAQAGTSGRSGWLGRMFGRESQPAGEKPAGDGSKQGENALPGAPGATLLADQAPGQGVVGGLAVVNPATGHLLVPMLLQTVPRMKHGGELFVGMPVGGGKLEAHVYPNRDKFWNWNPAPLELGLGANLARLGAGDGEKLTRLWGAYEPVEMGQGWFARLELYGQQLQPELPAYEGSEVESVTETGALFSLVWRPTLLK